MSMIHGVQSLDEAIVILRNKIVEISGLQNEFVINSLSVYGADLAKIIDETQYSIKQKALNPTETVNDSMIVFEVMNDEGSTDNMLQDFIKYAAYVMHITVYGESAEELAHSIKKELLMFETKAKLNYDGVHISSISNINAMNEFKNSVMWQRRDFDVNFAIRRQSN